MTHQPTSAADPRPNDRPFYVAPTCPDCGTLLVLWDALVMDWPPGEYEAMLAGEG